MHVYIQTKCVWTLYAPDRTPTHQPSRTTATYSTPCSPNTIANTPIRQAVQVMAETFVLGPNNPFSWKPSEQGTTSSLFDRTDSFQSSLECQGHLDGSPGHKCHTQRDTMSPHTLPRTEPHRCPYHIVTNFSWYIHKAGTILFSRIRTKGHCIRCRIRTSSLTISVTCEAGHCPRGS